MYQLEWSKSPPLAAVPEQPSRIRIDDIDYVYLLEWQEHCIECAIPHCYSICPLYVRRGDGGCSRLKYGIYPNRAVAGLHPFGADVTFRRWGKLEANLLNGIVRTRTARALQALNAPVVSILHWISSFVGLVWRDRKLLQWLAGLRRRMYAWITQEKPPAKRNLDDFLIELRSLESRPFRLIVETFRDRTLFRSALLVEPGYNLFRIPISELDTVINQRGAKIYLYPENDAEVRVIFTWLDFVGYRVGGMRPRGTAVISPPTGSECKQPAAKVKCVVWDLDNTLWDGILAEDGPEGVKLRPAALALIRSLDERGILQSVASKNNPDHALLAIEKFGLKDYFLYPSVGWGPKSHAIAAIAEKLNINIETLALIDDSATERAQVNDVYAQVRCYSDTAMSRLLEREEFDVPVSDESRVRRRSYLTESARQQLAETFHGDHEEFLRSCRLVANVFFPSEESSVKRCLELLLRSNQLNLSTRRYSEVELLQVLHDPEKMCVALACRDRFGEYGTVGFLVVDLSPHTPVLKDFVMSCRVAKKKVEHAVFRWLTDHLLSCGHTRLEASYLPSERNGVLLESLREVGFVEVEQAYGAARLLSLKCSNPIPASSVVAIKEIGQWRSPRRATVVIHSR